jgi:two-component system sensor histidine kinase KdpD
MVFTYKGEDIAGTILRFAAEYRVGHVVIGKTRQRPFWKRLGRGKPLVSDLLARAKGITVIVLDTHAEPAPSGPAYGYEESDDVVSGAAAAGEGVGRGGISALLAPGRVSIWDVPVDKETVLRTLASVAVPIGHFLEPQPLFESIMAREAQGSTFFNEGVAFPHVRVEGLESPVIALALTRKGVSGVATEKPVETVFLILSPVEPPGTQVQLLALTSRASQDRQLMRALRAVRDPEEALAAFRDWEAQVGRSR